ncbi:MAG: hypothetical protein RL380_1489, partial [Verrucomicrobiota bacterium]
AWCVVRKVFPWAHRKWFTHQAPRATFLLAAALILARQPSPAATVQLTPVADTTLSEYFPLNNFGQCDFLIFGTSERGKGNRALVKFDFATIPPGARIDSATLKIEVTRVPNNGFTPTEVGVYRLRVPWGEGSKTNPPGPTQGQGQPATVGEANWTNRFAFTTNTWARPGGGATNDYIATASLANTIYYPQDYTFPVSAPGNADVQLWLDQPATNFGWIFVVSNEQDLYTARRFGSREDSLNTPLLTVDYTPAPLLTNAIITSNQFQFQFDAEAGRSYAVETRASFAATNAWTPLTNFPAAPADTNRMVRDSISQTQRFYRLITP